MAKGKARSKHYYNNNTARLRHERQNRESEVPAIYASICMALFEGGFKYEQLADVCARSQEIWVDHSTNVIGMLIKCYNLTGIQLMTQDQHDWAVKKGYIEVEADDD